jgi:hypothetical protein
LISFDAINFDVLSFKFPEKQFAIHLNMVKIDSLLVLLQLKIDPRPLCVDPQDRGILASADPLRLADSDYPAFTVGERKELFRGRNRCGVLYNFSFCLLFNSRLLFFTCRAGFIHLISSFFVQWLNRLLSTSLDGSPRCSWLGVSSWLVFLRRLRAFF